MKSYDELREENRLLRQMLEQYRHTGALPQETPDTGYVGTHAEQVHRKAFSMSGGYFSYLAGNFRETAVYRLYRRLYRLFRPTMVVVRIIRYLLIFFTMLQASVVLLAVAAVSLVCLPFFLLAMLFVYLRYLLERGRRNEEMKKAILSKKVLVFFEEQGKERAFFDANMREMSESYTVFVVQGGGGFFGSVAKGAQGKKARFLTALRAGDSYYRLTPRYYFYLRRRYFDMAEMTAISY